MPHMRTSKSYRLNQRDKWSQIIENNRKGIMNDGEKYMLKVEERRRKEKEKADKAKENK